MAQGKTDGIREKVLTDYCSLIKFHSHLLLLSFQLSAVKEVVKGKSNDEITQVLQHYDEDIERTIQAFLDGERFSLPSAFLELGSRF
jgi:hypothetical protein